MKTTALLSILTLAAAVNLSRASALQPPPATVANDASIALALSPTEGLDQTPEQAMAWVSKHLYGPKTLLEHENGQAFATVPSRVILGEGPTMEVEFKRVPVREPLTSDQLPDRVTVVSRFVDGSEKAGAFLRNPTKERIVHLYTCTVQSLTFWEGHGYLLRAIGEGAPMVCGGVLTPIIDKDGKVTWEQPPQPEPQYAPGYHEPKPMAGTLDAKVHYCATAPVITSLTPTFSWPKVRTGTATHVYVQSIGQVDTCEASELPVTTSSAAVPHGALRPDTPYDLLVSRSAPLGGITITLYRFKTAKQDQLTTEPVMHEFSASEGRTE